MTAPTPKATPLPADVKFREEPKQAKPKPQPEKAERLLVKTASGGTMWDPEQNKYIEGEETAVRKTSWIERQLAAKKIVLVEE